MRTPTLALLAGATLLISASGATASTDCGRVNGGFELDIVATHLGCAAAKDVVRGWHKRAVTQAKGPGTKYVGSWYCHSTPTDPEHVRVSCARGTRKVRFSAGP